MNFRLLAGLSTANKSHTAFVRALGLSIVTVFGTTSCASIGTVILELDYTIGLVARSEAGKELWRAQPSQIITTNRTPPAANPFPSHRFVGPDFEWLVTADPTSFGGRLIAFHDSPVCLRFDQASISSNFHVTPKLLHRPPGGGKGLIGEDSGHEDARVAALKAEAAKGRWVPEFPFRWPQYPIACATPQVKRDFSFAVNFSDLYPTAKLFNTNQTGKDLNYTERGVGNWLKITVPVEYAGKREILEMTLTGKDSRARMSYH
jgi:hypothetical protein